MGWKKITAVFIEGDDDDFRLWEIAENLHRSELTVLERSEHIAEWIRLTEKKIEFWLNLSQNSEDLKVVSAPPPVTSASIGTTLGELLRSTRSSPKPSKPLAMPASTKISRRF